MGTGEHLASCWGLCRRWGSSGPTGRVLGWVYLKQGSFLWSLWDTHSSCRDEMTLPVQKGPFCDIFTQVQPSWCCPLAGRVPKSQLPCLQVSPTEGSVITAGLLYGRTVHAPVSIVGNTESLPGGWRSSRLSGFLGWAGLVWTWPSVTVSRF